MTYHFTTIRAAKNQQTKTKIKSADTDVEKLDPVCMVVGA
jgi:hypothetical protein